ncbi:glucan endo-1,3-beta-glucosidase 11-like [Panicum miliaceum]|uniref:Glucan endo-1,3-beta-glucosidase 11-like n=1 Tax=Panicum miliaceum TaxID=4540 RepID=A0A3L6S4S1_PANMI|nr:glucan endo-1,3-beta-glucosidase 11-like [Panicum miliaceum]
MGQVNKRGTTPGARPSASQPQPDLEPSRCHPSQRRASQAHMAEGERVPFQRDTKIAVLTVGNEVLTGGNRSALSRVLLPAMQSLHGAVAALGLDKQITVTTAHNLGVLGTSYPPSAGAFRKDLLPYLCPILDYQARTGSPFLVNAYPYFAYSDDPKGVQLDYALLEPGYAGVQDPNSRLHYPNLLVAQVDAVYHAIAAANTAASRVVEVRVSETGWPSAGAANETGATPRNAARYNSNAMRLVAEGRGTPLKPGVPLRAYVFALFNENLKPGLASERYYGLFKPMARRRPLVAGVGADGRGGRRGSRADGGGVRSRRGAARTALMEWQIVRGG